MNATSYQLTRGFLALSCKLLFGVLMLLAFSVNGQDAEKETTHQLYKRLSQQVTGKFGTNNHTFYPKVSLSISYGENMVAEDQVEFFDHPNYLSMDMRGGYQSIGKNVYDQLWRYPEWGVGYYGTKLYNDTAFGVPNAVFAYIDIPFNKWNPNKRWSFSYSIAGGLSFNFRPNNAQENPVNTLIGSYNNVYIDIAFYANYMLSKSLDAKLGLSFVHFSNGASTLPNMGMNLFGPKLIVQHHLVRERPEVYVWENIPEWRKKHGLLIYQAFGTKQIEEHGESYLNTTTSLAYKYWWRAKGQWIGMVDLFYDSSNNDRVNTPNRGDNANYFTVGLFAGYEAIYNRWSFVSGWGFNVYRTFDSSDSPFYQRFGVRYRVWDGIQLGVGLKARTFAADYIEWSIGYSLF